MGKDRVVDWCLANYLDEKCKNAEPAKPLKSLITPSKPANTTPSVKNKPSGEVVKKSYKKTKTAGNVKNDNEIDDIFNSL